MPASKWASVRTARALQPIKAKPNFFRLLLLLAAAYSYVLVQLFQDEWKRAESSSGPIVLVLALWLLFRIWDESNVGNEIRRARVVGILLLFFFAAIMFMLGVVGQISELAYGSIIPFVSASILLFQNKTAQPKLMLPVFFLLFSIPLPGFIVDPITLPLKQVVAAATEGILHALAYPVARSGVIIYLGQYELQVADACAGLRTLFTLEALGLMYLNLFEFRSALRNICLALLVVPISIIANIIRVVSLCLITYTWGDDAGQGFLHQFAGMVLFLCALLLLLAADSGLRAVVRCRRATRVSN
jgi:exosortase B